jgi:hypothetical protein
VDQYHARVNTARYVNWGLGAAFLVATGVGVLQAEVNYVPAKKETRKRAIDLGHLDVAPNVSSEVKGLSLTGRF